jgi:hypothetical protein
VTCIDLHATPFVVPGHRGSDAEKWEGGKGAYTLQVAQAEREHTSIFVCIQSSVRTWKDRVACASVAESKVSYKGRPFPP